jgi:hypothetical protein
MARNDDVRVLHWADMMRTLRLFGHVKDFSKQEGIRVARLLKEQVEKGNAVRVKRGRYRVEY